ncbi:MAG: hypothetical protein U1E76_00810 [Planctomycetota bacterium]
MESTAARAARQELDNLVVNIELTLISIIQGIALSFLIGTSYPLVVGLELRCWPFIATGLLIILLFWARAIIHTLTVIRWPLRLGHNFLYIGSTAVESLMFTQMGDPVWWHALGTLYAALIWLLFAVDLRMMRQVARMHPHPGGAELFRILEQDQLMNARKSMPLTTVGMAAITLWFASSAATRSARVPCVIAGVLQLAGAAAYLSYVVRFLERIAPLVLRSREELQA